MHESALSSAKHTDMIRVRITATRTLKKVLSAACASPNPPKTCGQEMQRTHREVGLLGPTIKSTALCYWPLGHCHYSRPRPHLEVPMETTQQTAHGLSPIINHFQHCNIRPCQGTKASAQLTLRSHRIQRDSERLLRSCLNRSSSSTTAP